jgi:hypothetical protein
MYQLKNFLKKFVRRQEQLNWSIGIYTGNSPLNLSPHPVVANPVLTAKNVTDVEADFVADPFMIYEGSTWYMFFEVLDIRDDRGKIGLAVSQDGLRWDYQKIVLEEPFHLSYPYIFKWEDEYYMIPETYQTNSIRLYKATNFPTRWKLLEVLLDDHSYVDASIVYYQNRWWIFSSETENTDRLYLHYSEQLLGPWIEHPLSPVVQYGEKFSRSAGRVINSNHRLFRYTQDCRECYGKQVYAFEITELTPDSYQDQEVQENPILQPSRRGWNRTGMHTIDPHQIAPDEWLACVDGKRVSQNWKFFGF